MKVPLHKQQQAINVKRQKRLAKKRKIAFKGKKEQKK